MQLIPDSNEFLEGKGPERHSAKAHRCVDKVQAKGHDESSAWAICTDAIGKRGTYAKGHGGSANPKRKVREVAQFDHPFFEANDCHNPAGSATGGQFCSDGPSAGAVPVTKVASLLRSTADAHGAFEKSHGATPWPEWYAKQMGPKLGLPEAQLTDLLKGAKDAHTAFEKATGPDKDWAGWYADWMVKRLKRK